MVRLFNHTKYPDQILRDVLNFAARCAGVVGDVPVKVDESYHLSPVCTAYRAWPYRRTLTGKPNTSTDKRILKCPIGYVVMRIPAKLVRRHWMDTPGYSDPAANARCAAESFVNASIHEMAHIRQYRTPLLWCREFAGHRPQCNRRMAHDSRPCEIDAENTVYAVQQNRAKNLRRQQLADLLVSALLAAHPDPPPPTPPAPASLVPSSAGIAI